MVPANDLGEIALVLAAAFAGAALYVNVAEQPARLHLGDESLLAQWKESYPRGTRMQASAAALSGLLGLLTAIVASDWRWAVGAAFMLANWPYTFLVVMPVNNRLGTLAQSGGTDGARGLIVRWGHLHAVRTFLGIAGTAAYFWALH